MRAGKRVSSTMNTRRFGRPWSRTYSTYGDWAGLENDGNRVICSLTHKDTGHEGMSV
jgi:hypothetical protein